MSETFPTSAESLKRRAAQSAVTRVRSGMRLGLGTGSTIQHFLEELAARLRDGVLSDLVGVPTSVRTERAAADLGIATARLEDLPELDLAVDGADEVSADLGLIKGLGGALLREKMVVQAARAFVVIADDSKRVERLGTKAPLPVEVVRFGWRAHDGFLRALGAEPSLRLDAQGNPYVTDNGNFILDCRFPAGIGEPTRVDRALQARAGIVETGLFLGLATEAHLAAVNGVDVLARQDAQ
jgi:ribose 5-phosphate isomerase A